MQAAFVEQYPCCFGRCFITSDHLEGYISKTLQFEFNLQTLFVLLVEPKAISNMPTVIITFMELCQRPAET